MSKPSIEDYARVIDHYMNSRSKSCEQLWVTLSDISAFSDALRTAFPRLVYVSGDYWKSFVDWDFWYAALDEYNQLRDAGIKAARPVHRMRDPSGQMPPCWRDLTVGEETSFYGWLLPESWVPQWGEADDEGIRRIENTPRQRFYFSRSRFRRPQRRHPSDEVWSDEPPTAHDEDDVIHLYGSSISIGYSRYDDETEAFARALFRILGTLSVDRFIQVDPDTWRARSPVPERNRRYGMAGRHAEAWAMARRHNYFYAGPLYKPAGYPFAPEEFLSPEELAAEKAQDHVEIEAAYQQMMKESKLAREAERRKKKAEAQAAGAAAKTATAPRTRRGKSP